ncbi:venom allergen 5-like [Condylostylus longicornis]|uniref:venom allergen 5-like n=1 Tax=Condylostylus longicornis TaxID=2530218 RepID=UPI00244E2F33|nr:venom allergen 5-like [Condylostylus longicornis]
MRWFIFFGLLSLANSLSDTVDTAKKFCNMSNLCYNGAKSIACLYTSSTKPACNGTILPFNTKAVVQKHNDYRQAIASGKYSPKFSTAASMPELVYSDELAQMALYNVKKCDFKHDACHQTNNFPNAGQNIAMAFMTLGVFDAAKTDSYISEFIDSWFSEYSESNMNEIKSLPPNMSSTGHFLQMVQEKCRHVGCAFISYVEDNKDNVIFACNYGYGNMLNDAVYTTGPPASQCASKSKSYSALCSA